MTAKSRYKRYFLANGTDARVRSHSSCNTPPRPSPSGAMAIVNCSTAWASRSTFMSTRAKSYCASYWVPDCPVVRLRINFQPSGEGMVQRLYLPAGTAVPAITRSAQVQSLRSEEHTSELQSRLHPECRLP